MELTVDAHGVEVDAWLRDFIRTTVVFAVWHYDVPEAVRVRLDEARDADGEPYVRCTLEVERPGMEVVTSGATGPDVCEAVQRTADLMEVALHRRRSPAPERGEERLAA